MSSSDDHSGTETGSPTPADGVAVSSSASPETVTFDDRLVAESIRLIEHDGRRPLEDPAAEQAARSTNGDLEMRLVVRAARLPVADDVRHALSRLRTGLAWVIVLGLFIAFLLGAVTARTTMAAHDETRINFYWVLGGTLGVQTILLVVWIVVLLRWLIRSRSDLRQRAESPMLISLGHFALMLSHWLAARLRSADHARSTLQAVGNRFATGSIGFWTFSAITHAVWLSFNVGALTLILLLLAARQYTFVWETTILHERHYVTMTRALSAPARAAGFVVPTDDDITASQWTGQPPPAEADEALVEGRSQRWASLLVASITLYGLGPRLTLVVLALSMRRRACRLYRLDTDLPGYQRLRPRLMPTMRSLGVVDADDSIAGSRSDASDARTASASQPRPASPPAILGIEITPPAIGWPPPLGSRALMDLGIIESRDDRARILESLRSADREPDPLIIVCDLTATPDRGLGNTITSIMSEIDRSPLLLLTGGQSLRDRGYDGEQVAQRITDWRALAEQTGISDHDIIEVDLDHVTDTARQQLIDRLPGGDADHSAAEVPLSRRIESACVVIQQHADRWRERNTAPNERDQMALQREIAELYRHNTGGFRSLLSLNPDSPCDLMDEMKSGAARFVDLLPDRLRRSPKWLAAGACAGAFGCIATAAMISPIAIAALPSWSVIGAAIAAAVQPSSSAGRSVDFAQPPDVTDAIRAAALFAVTLELQGRGEATITRVLDEVFNDELVDPGTALTDAPTIDRWLKTLRHRFDLALASHTAPRGDSETGR